MPRDPSKDYYYIMRDTPNNETIIVEYGFADSNGDDVNQIKNNWEVLAEAVTKAITEYVGGTYITKNNSNYYTVKSGDTLWSIAKKYNVSVDELKNTNNLVSNLLSVGQNLIIPSMIEKNDEYIVKPGDTLYKIANLFNTTVDNLKSINKLVTDSLSIGQIIKLPNNNSSEENDSGNYIVKKGDTLYSLANMFKTSVNDLKMINNLESDILSIGQKLVVPTFGSKTYTVKKGDSLYSIAREIGTTVSKLIDLNNLESDILSIGQKLIIP